MFRLSKIAVYQHYYGWALAWLLIAGSAPNHPDATAAMLLFLLGSAGIVTCACSADDLVGYRNGSDAVNYRAGDRRRNINRKPLLSGAVTERQAVRFMLCAGLVAAVAGIGAFWVLDWRAPIEAYALYFGGFFFSVQYSAGLRLSYHRGGGELLLCFSTASGLLAPYVAVSGDFSAPAVIVAFLLGLWMVMVSSYSNVNDACGDAQVGRRTLAVATDSRVVMGAMVGFFLLSVALVCALALNTTWPWWTLLTLIPATILHLHQLRLGPGQWRWLLARRYGLYANDLGFLGLLVPAVHVLLR